MIVRFFGWSIGVTIAALVTAYFYGGWSALVLCMILGVLEVSLSFDNAVVNARVLERMSDFWQKMFLTVGIVIAVFGMRIVFPLLLVSITAGLGPIEALDLALERGDPETPGTYGYLLEEAHPTIAAFGGMFLLMIFLSFFLNGEQKEHQWLTWLERPLAKIGKLDGAPYLFALAILYVSAEFLAENTATVAIAGILGLITYMLVNGLGELFNVDDEDEEGAEESSGFTEAPAGLATKVADEKDVQRGPNGLVRATGKAAFFLFLYLEVLDASFSFDGVIGAFAITSDPIIIALGLGLIGAMFVRSLTRFFVKQGTLDDYVYLDSGAHWAIGALAAILLLTIGIHINEIITGLIGVVLIVAAFYSSIRRNKRVAAEAPREEVTV